MTVRIKFESSRRWCCLGWTGVAGEEKRETRRRCSEMSRWQGACAACLTLSLTHIATFRRWITVWEKAGGQRIVLLPIIGIVPHTPLGLSEVANLASECCDDAVSKGEYLGRTVTGGT